MRHIVDTTLRVIIIVIFSVLVACVTWQVASRYLFGVPSTLTDEIARFLFMWLALIGGAYTLGLRRHLAIDLLTMNLKGRAKLISEAVILAAITVFAAVVMLWGGASLVTKTFASGQVTPALQMPMGWVYAAIPFSGLVMLYYCGVFALELARGEVKATSPAAVAGPLD
ncbi:TRAP transporter small permease [Tropicimonas sp. IMCC34043]|uniref:TRAP transporter small permease n=1 Tax=Tropicimonas sp. IMCC34043 TaxID=2248760 RepID=UPI000E237086|nr:TRAP transporter small permease [Tropicimonas sp. IMCC34043]